MKSEDLIDDKKHLELAIVMSYGSKQKIKKEVRPNLRKAIARINTILNERRLKNG